MGASASSSSASSASTTQMESAIKQLYSQLGGKQDPLALPKPKLAPIDWDKLEAIVKGAAVGKAVAESL